MKPYRGHGIAVESLRGMHLRFDQIVMLSLAGLIGLTPLTVYLLGLGTIARRRRPTVVAGRWDFIALFLALFGFLLFGGGLLLSFLHSNSLFAIRGNWQLLHATLAQERTAWAWTAVAYFLVIVALVAWELFARRRVLVIYNVTPAVLEPMLVEFFEQRGLPLTREGYVWSAKSGSLFRLEAFEAGRTATLRWINDNEPTLFQEVERHLRECLPSVLMPENPTVLWIRIAGLASTSLAAVSFAILVLMIR